MTRELKMAAKLACKALKRFQPRVLWVSSECGPYSPLQRSHARNLPEYLAFADEMHMYAGVCNGFQVNLRNKENQLLCKGWRLDSTWPELSKHMNLRCGGQHGKGAREGGVYFTAHYKPEFGQAFAEVFAA